MTEDAAAEERRERGRLLFAGPIDFMLGVVSMETLPVEGAVEVAFAGRSNVGKSTLLNALAGRSNLARTSSTPGRTREMNFFAVGDLLRLVDLPGFGYARAARKEAERWAALARDYLKGRSRLRRVFLLVDSRRGLKDVDCEVMDMLDTAAVNYQLVLTKADKIKASELDEVISDTTKRIVKRPAAHPTIIATSAETGVGIGELRATIADLI